MRVVGINVVEAYVCGIVVRWPLIVVTTSVVNVLTEREKDVDREVRLGSVEERDEDGEVDGEEVDGSEVEEVCGVVEESMGVEEVEGVIEFVVGMEDVVGMTMGVEEVVIGVEELSFNCLRSTSLRA
jgi:hypothetical protein